LELAFEREEGNIRSLFFNRGVILDVLEPPTFEANTFYITPFSHGARNLQFGLTL